MPFVTWNDLVQLGILVCAVVSVVLQANINRNKRK